MAYFSHNVQEGATPLILAAAEGHIEIVRLLMEKGANIEAINHV